MEVDTDSQCFRPDFNKASIQEGLSVLLALEEGFKELKFEELGRLMGPTFR